MKIFKRYSSSKGRTTVIGEVDGRHFGWLEARDAAAIASADCQGSAAITVNSAIFSDGSAITRTFTMVRYGRELLKVSWDGKKPTEPTISLTTHAEFNNLLARYRKDPRWTEVSLRETTEGTQEGRNLDPDSSLARARAESRQ